MVKKSQQQLATEKKPLAMEMKWKFMQWKWKFKFEQEGQPMDVLAAFCVYNFHFIASYHSLAVSAVTIYWQKSYHREQ